MTKQTRFFKEIKPFMLEEKYFSFVVTDTEYYDKPIPILFERGKYNIEVVKAVYGFEANAVMYVIFRTPKPNKHWNNGYKFQNSMTQSCYAHLSSDGTKEIDVYETIKHKTNCCQLCLLCDPETNIIKFFHKKRHNNSKKHINNVTLYGNNIKETLSKKVNDDVVNEILSYL